MAVALLKPRCLSQHHKGGISIYSGAKNWESFPEGSAFEEQNTAHSFWNAAAVGGEMLYNTQAVTAPAKLCDPALRVSPVSFLMIM